MNRRFAYILLILVYFSGGVSAEESNTRESIGLHPVEEYGLSFIDEEKLFAHLNFISSNLFEGREATERGAELTAEYAAALFRMWGLRPVGDDLEIGGRHGPSYFQKFNVIEYEPLQSSALHIEIQQSATTQTIVNFAYEVDFTMGGGVSNNVTISAPVVFVGYGMVVEEENFDELKNVNVKNKVVLLMSGVPRPDDESLRWNQSGQRFRFGNIRTRIERLEERGAAGVLIVRSPHQEADLYSTFVENVDHHHPRFNRFYEGDEPMEPRRRMRLADSQSRGIATFEITRTVANTILSAINTNLDEITRAIDDNLRPQSRDLSSVKAVMKADVRKRVLWTSNVLGMIEGSDPDLKHEVVIVGAHYDHDGKRSGYIWNGADDNGSGTSGVLTLAHTFATAPERPKRSVLFALWGAEEKGLLGSRYFVDNPVVPLERIVTKKNLDMIGRDQERPEAGIYARDNTNQVFVTVSEQMPMLEELTLRNNGYTNLDITLRVTNVTGGGSDHVPFARRGIPVSFFFTGFHADYHQPSDTVEKINFEKMTRIVRLAFLNVWSLANYTGSLEIVEAD